MKYIPKFLIFTFLLLGILITSGCNKNITENSNNYTSQIFALDTVIEITAYGENAQESVTAAEKEIRRLEKVFSVTDENSDIYKLNNTNGKESVIDTEAYLLLDYAKYISTLTDGNFDVTIYPIMKLWGFTHKEYNVPDSSKIKDTLPLVNSENIILSENNTVKLQNKTQVDLGGIAKGYIADKAAQAMKSAGLEYGIISLGGNIRTVGTKPSGESFSIGIKDPNSEDYFAIINSGECSVVTSGAYQRNFTLEGQTYHHIIDPKTGYPADSDIASITVIGEDGALCDALSTAIFVGGSEYADTLYNQSILFDYVILTKDNQVIASLRLEGRLSLADGYENLEITYR